MSHLSNKNAYKSLEQRINSILTNNNEVEIMDYDRASIDVVEGLEILHNCNKNSTGR